MSKLGHSVELLHASDVLSELVGTLRLDNGDDYENVT